MNVIWIVSMKGKGSRESAILCCFDDEDAANALCDTLNASDAGGSCDFYVDDSALIKVAP